AGKERPEQKQQIRRGRLEQRRDVDVEGTEAHTVVPELGAGSLIECFNLIRGSLATKHAEILGELVSQAPGKSREVGGLAESNQRLDLSVELRREPCFEALEDAFALRGWQVLVGHQLNAGLERRRPLL